MKKFMRLNGSNQLHAHYANSFIKTMEVAGLKPPDNLIPNKFYRFNGVGKDANNKAAWCILFDGGTSGCFGDWASGMRQIWFHKNDAFQLRHKQVAISNLLNKAYVTTREEIKHQQLNAALKAKNIFNYSVPVDLDHPYLLKKRIHPYSAHEYKGLITLEIKDFYWQTWSLQFIEPSGQKRMLKYGRKTGCFIHVAGDTESFASIIICEGWATGCTLAEQNSESLVLAAIDAGNLKPIAISARIKWPTAKIIIAGDDDRLTYGNPGASKARTAAISANALIALPQWPKDAPLHLTDFNDLANWISGGVQ